MSNILVYALYYEGAFNKNSLGAVSEAARLAGELGTEAHAVAVGDVMAKVMTDNDIKYALFGGGLLGFEIGAGLAARLGAGVTMEVTAVNVEDGKLAAERPILGDSSISTSRYRDRGIVIGRLNAFEPRQSDGATAAIEDVDVELSRWSTPAGTRTRPRSARRARPSRRSSTWPPASPAPSSTRSACSLPRTSWRS